MTTNNLHVVLGANGVIGREVLAELKRRDLPAVGVGRSPRDGSRHANLLDREQTQAVLTDASHVYMCVGLPYLTKVWEEQFPKINQNVISAVEHANARLIVLDNVYLYGRLPVPFDEQAPQNPVSRKGEIRKEMIDEILQAHTAGRVHAVIGRAADFYGPGATRTVLYPAFVENILQGKRPQWLGKPGIPHSWAYTEDVGKALVQLALDHDAYGRAWHLPVEEPARIEELLEIINRHMSSSWKVSYLPTFLRRPLGWFSPTLASALEMVYQFDAPYIMDDSAFRTRYPDFVSTSHDIGIPKWLDSPGTSGDLQKVDK